MIKVADKNDIDGLKKIWESCFTNDKAIIDNFFNNCFPFCTTFIYNEGNHPVSCLSLIPTFCILDNQQIALGYYLYAVGTLPENRGLGLSKHLVTSAFEHCKQNNSSFICVYPASDSLYDLYLQLNFDNYLFSSAVTTDININSYFEETKIKSLKEISKEDLYVIRLNSGANKIFMHDCNITKFIFLDTLNKQGKAIEILSSYGNKYYLIAIPLDKNESIIEIIETNLDINTNINFATIAIGSFFLNVKQIITSVPFTNQSSLKQNNGLIHIFDQSISQELLSRHLSIKVE